MHVLMLSLVPVQSPGWEGAHSAAHGNPSPPPCGQQVSLQSLSPPATLHSPTLPLTAAGAWTHHLLWFQVYVQDILQQQLADQVLHVLHKEQGHLYVCGDVRMARDVTHTLKQLMAAKLSLSEEEVEDYFFQLKVWQRVCGLGMQVKSMGQGARTAGVKTGGVRIRTVLDVWRILEVAGGLSRMRS